MRIGILGLNHKSAGLHIREKLAKACTRRFGSPAILHPHFSYVLLNTCNRTEIYFSSDDLAHTHTQLLAILRDEIKQEFEHHVYAYFNDDCFYHLACVTAGVDSALIGETEIQGQVKRAYEQSAESRPLNKELHFLFQKCLKIGKQVRTHHLPDLPTLDEAIIHASHTHLGTLSHKHILFVGLSEINEKIHKAFRRRGIDDITFCNRTLDKVQNRRHIPWSNLHAWPHFDLIICGTNSPTYLIKSAPSLTRPKLLIDLSVPRNVCPHLTSSPHLSLLNIDELNQSIDQKRQVRAAHMGRLHTHVIAAAVSRQVNIFKNKELRPALVHAS